MADRQRLRQVSDGLPTCALLAAALALSYTVDAAALPLHRQTAPPPSALLLIADPSAGQPEVAQPAATDEERAPFAELNEALAAARARLEELSKAAEVAASAGQVRQELAAVKQENQGLTAELAELRASRDELQRARQDAEARIASLAKAVEEAAGEAKGIEEEMVALRWQNAQLNTSLARAQAAREKIELEAQKTQEVLVTKVETLSASAEQSAAEIGRLRKELADAEQRLEVATTARDEAQARLAELRDTAEAAEARNARLDQQLAAFGGQVSQAQDQRDKAQARVAELQSETAELRTALDAAQSEAGQVARSNDELEREVAELRAAANSAADAARQNLLAVEERIRELNDALAGIAPATGPAAPSPTPAAAPVPVPAEADEASADNVEVAATTSNQTAADADLDLIKSAAAANPEADEALERLTSDLPLEERLQVEGLLVDLNAKVDERGLAMTVPGENLFAMNSDTIEPTAHDTLAKVAELIEAYKGHDVVIVGHTDAIGEARYNELLSQRRARLVKQFFVDNFAIDSERLLTEGHGEARPIARNDTLEGRQANRRVEVLILN